MPVDDSESFSNELKEKVPVKEKEMELLQNGAVANVAGATLPA